MPLLERRRRLLTENIDTLRTAFRTVRAERPFDIGAIVILPDHLHGLWTLPSGDSDFSSRRRLIKATFPAESHWAKRLSERRRNQRERGIRQQRFREHAIRDRWDFDTRFDDIQHNPVKHAGPRM